VVRETFRVRLFIVKPDNIGDFVLASGAIRLLGREAGPENVTLCVKSILVPLAKAQYPEMQVIELPVAAKRKVMNLFLRNFLMCLPLLVRLKFTRFDTSVCLRSMRTYLETLVFLLPGARRFVANENILLRSGRRVRIMVENGVNGIRHTELAPYPDAVVDVPLEIEAHRRVVEQVLKRPVNVREVMPQLLLPPKPTADSNGSYWVFAPLTSEVKKNYPIAAWIKALELVPIDLLPARILLTGSPDQREALEEFLAAISKSRLRTEAEILLPEDLVKFAGWIGHAGMVLTGDTAAAHFATAMDRRAVVLFSGRHTGMFGPWRRSARQQWLVPDGPSDKPKPKWHERIAPERAASTLVQLLQVSNPTGCD
jgi:ADP-heptose:LPS heptosyltransferase